MRKSVIKQVEHTYEEVICDKCGVEIVGDEQYLIFDYVRNDLDFHKICFEAIVLQATNAYVRDKAKS